MNTGSTSGAFVLGDKPVAVGAQVTFWGSEWWKDNILSGGLAPAAFKGFADTSTATCGETWSTLPGNSSDAPPAVSGTVPMVVASHITQSGDVISGDTREVVMVQVDPGYASNPGHAGTGTVVSIVACDGGGSPT